MTAPLCHDLGLLYPRHVLTASLHGAIERSGAWWLIDAITGLHKALTGGDDDVMQIWQLSVCYPWRVAVLRGRVHGRMGPTVEKVIEQTGLLISGVTLYVVPTVVCGERRCMITFRRPEEVPA